MVRRIDNIGLIVNLVKLNGKLELHFSSDTMFAAHYTILGTDVDDTLEIEYAREAAAGQSVVSLGLEMFVEDAQGFLDVRFEGAIGSTLAFQHDGRDLGCLLGFKETSLSGPFARLDIALDAAGSLHTPITGHVPLLGFPGIQGIPRVTRDAKVQTINQKTRNAKVQTIAPNFTHAGVQTKRKRMVNTGAQTAAATNKLHNASGPFPSTIDRFSRHEVSRAMKTLPEVAHTFTNAVATVFQTFNEPHDPYRQKRQAEPAADYRAYKHIFIEGYRNGDGKEEEGRLHVDLAHHVLLWESYDNYEGGAKLTLDRLDLPRCEVFHERLKHVHYFGDHQIQLRQKKSHRTVFCMNYKTRETEIYGNNLGNGDERFHCQGEGRVQNVLDAIQECLDFKAKYIAPRLD